MKRLFMVFVILCAMKTATAWGASFTNNGNGTVTDNGTGLMWQQGEHGRMALADAMTYCEGLSLGGQSDWRLPNVKELESITDDTKYLPAIDTTYFPNTYNDVYWSSTTYAYYTYVAWSVNFHTGGVVSYVKLNDFYVRCVRGGQSGAVCNLTISPTSQTFTSAAGTGTVTVTASDSSCAWTASSTLSWVAITSGATGTGNGTVTISVAANTSGASRTGNITIENQTYTITQSAACSFTISPNSQSLTSSSASANVTVTASASSCAWTASESLDWATITSGNSGTGSGTVNISVAENTTGASRTGSITIAGQAYTITQSACSYNISPTSLTFTSATDSDSVTVTTSSNNCAWTSTSSLPWATITSGSSGTGSETVAISVAANTTANARTGDITIAGQTFTITQDGAEQNNCAASISSNLVVHIPIVTFSGSNYWADLQYNSANSTLTVAGADKVTDISPYSTCAAPTLSSDYKLHIPVVMINGISYWLDLQYNGTVFVNAGYGQN